MYKILGLIAFGLSIPINQALAEDGGRFNDPSLGADARNVVYSLAYPVPIGSVLPSGVVTYAAHMGHIYIVDPRTLRVLRVVR